MAQEQRVRKPDSESKIHNNSLSNAAKALFPIDKWLVTADKVRSLFGWSVFGILFFFAIWWFMSQQPVSRQVALVASLAIVVLVAVFPITFLAYQQAMDDTRIERLKADFSLMGLFAKDDDENTVEALYRRVYNPFQYGAYIALIVVFSAIMLILFTTKSDIWLTHEPLGASSISITGSTTGSQSSPTRITDDNPLAVGSVTSTAPLTGLPAGVPNTTIVAATAQVAPSELERNNVITLVFVSFLGAYVYAVQELVRRYNTIDLLPQVYSSILARMLLATSLTFVAASAIGTFGGSLGPASGVTTAPGYTSIWGPAVLAFVIGIFPTRGVQWLRNIADRVLGKSAADAPELPIQNLLGMSTWHASRLEQMGIDDAQNLAAADLRRLLLTTPFDPQVLANWIDQAILYVKVGTDKITRFRDAQITTYHELLCAIPNITKHRLEELSSLSEHERSEIDKFALAVGFTSADEFLRMVDTMNFPNYIHIREYYQRQPDLVQYQADLGYDLNVGLLDDGKYALVIERIERMRKQRGQRTPAAKLNQLGEAYLEQYRNLVAQAPNSATHNSSATESLKNAVKAFKQAIANDPNMAQAHYNLSQCNYLQKNMEETISNCSMAIYLNRCYTDAYVGRAIAFIDQGKWAEAEADLVLALERNDRMPDAYFNKAVLQTRNDDDSACDNADQKPGWRRAVEDTLCKAYLCGYDSSSVDLQRGNMCLRIQDYAEGSKQYSTAIESGLKAPLLWQAYANRALCLALCTGAPHHLPDFHRKLVLDALETSYKNGYRAPDSSLLYASILKQDGNAEDATRVLNELIANSKDMPKPPREYFYAVALCQEIAMSERHI